MVRVEVKPALLRWARERAGLSTKVLRKRFPKLEAWEEGTAKPTLRQVEEYARVTASPVGFLFLEAPPEERVPIPDFRTVGNEFLGRPSPDLLETIYICQERQEWYRDFLRSTGEDAHEFVGSASRNEGIVEAANRIREALRFSVEERAAIPTWTEALVRFIDQADAIGVLVMSSGIVLSNTRRKLDPQEFRGFALVDAFAPVVFVNGADTKAAQMFTLAHELAHVWLGQSAVSDAEPSRVPEHGVERWCNQVAAELLVPLAAMRREYDRRAPLGDELARLARRFKVSTLVILRRMHDAGGLSWDEMWAAYEEEVQRLRELMEGGGGGNFYATEVRRVSERFARAVVGSALEGHTLYRDAFRMLGFSKVDTFEELGRRLGVIR